MRYKAFISYSHQDERWGARLHKRLETFKFPRRVIGQQTDRGPVPENLKPVFRDKVELSAGANLSEALQRRLRESENLIVICSPRSAQSYWVNEEILFFKRHNNPDNIFAFIIDGEPNAENPDDECFPPALKFALDDQGEQTDIRAEPLAADARKEGEGPRMALLQVLSGMAGLGLDDLVRRDLQRARRRVTLITVSAISAMIVMGALTGIALDARGEAEARKNDAEGLIEFMLTDLRDKLEPVGRLDALDAVGQRASDYYNQYDLNALDADSVGRYAQINHLLGDIQLRMGNISEAKKYFEPVYETTKRQLEADPDNPDRIYEHIQSVFWVAQPAYKTNNDEAILESYKSYLDLAERLLSIEGETVRAVQEMAYGLSNVGNAYFRLQNYEQAQNYSLPSLGYYQRNIDLTQTAKSKLELSRRYQDVADIFYHTDDKQTGYEWELKRSTILNELSDKYANDFLVSLELAYSKRDRSEYLRQFTEFSKADLLLNEALEIVESLIQAEPNNDSALKLRLIIFQSFINLAIEINDLPLEEEYAEKYAKFLDQRLKTRSRTDFDIEWDFIKPRDSISSRLQVYLKTQDYEKVRNLLKTYDQLYSNLQEIEGFESEARWIKVHHLLTKLVVDEDVWDFVELQKVMKSESQSEELLAFSKMYTLFSYHFCTNKSVCEVIDYPFETKDFESSSFLYFQKIYPETAHKIQSQLKRK